MAFHKDKLRELRLTKGISQSKLAEKLNLGKSTISMYEAGKRVPDFETLEAICDYFNVDMQVLSDVAKTHTPSNLFRMMDETMIPIVGKVACGQPIFAEEYVEGYISVNRKHETCWALRIKGDSMQPKLMDGDIAIIQPTVDVHPADMAIVTIGNEEATCKHVKKAGDGIMLVAENPAVYEPTFYTAQDVSTLPIRIIGKVIESRRQY